MHLRNLLLIITLGFIVLDTGSSTLRAETRAFTDTSGRTIRGELVGTNGDFVTIKREDGQNFTVKASNFSPADIDYFKEHGLKAAPAPEAKATPAENSDALPANALVIEAFIDGPSELRVRKDGLYWINFDNAKPGKHDNANYPTYINGKAWQPGWKNARKARGADKSSVHATSSNDPGKLELKLLAVTLARGQTGIEKRDEIKVSVVDQELSIIIPDGQSGARWYKFALIPKKG